LKFTEEKVRSDELKQVIRVAGGEEQADLVLKGGSIINVFTGEILPADVALCGPTIAAVGPSYRGKTERDVSGKWVAPGLIEGHIHIESSMLIPSAFASAVAPRGTTAVVADPHEIANVMGLEGLSFMMQESKDAVIDIFFMAPSCVPATSLETSGARLEAEELKALLSEKRVLGLAEMMNFPGVIHCIDNVISKFSLFQGRVIDGHAPLLMGRGLQAYLASGIGSDHECVLKEEAVEKLRCGVWLMIRDGTSAHNLEALLPAVNPMNSFRVCLVSDDLQVEDIMQAGHLDRIIRKAIALGLDPATAVRMASLNPAQYFRLHRRGAVAPGYLADLIVISDLMDFEVEAVYKDGAVIAQQGFLTSEGHKAPLRCKNSFNCKEIGEDLFKVFHPGGKARVIEVILDQIITREILSEIPMVDGLAVPDLEHDILKLCVLERHRGSGNIGIGFVKGFGFRRGALASSVAHDSHNLIAVGTSDSEIRRAMEAVKGMGGGIAVACGDNVLASLPLPVAGLMSYEPMETLAPMIREVKESCRELGCSLRDPMMTLSFLALPVIPELKLTDKGLIDVKAFRMVPLFKALE
jgi:adenine deaminase